MFEDQDDLLTSVGLVTVYFMEFPIAENERKLGAQLVPRKLAKFDQLRRHNRSLLGSLQVAVAAGDPVDASVKIRRDLAIFDRLMQSPSLAAVPAGRAIGLRRTCERV